MLVNINVKCLNKRISIDDDKLIGLLPELKRELKNKEINLKHHLLYYLKNKSNFENITQTEIELEKELLEITTNERERWIKPPLERIKQEKKIDKQSWRNYKWLP